MNPERTVSVIAPAGGRKNFVAIDMPVSKLAAYSRTAQYRYFSRAGEKKPYRHDEKRALNNSEFDLGDSMNEDFARILLTHIKRSDPSNPAPFTLELVGKNRSFEELIEVWRIIGHGLKTPRGRHDETIRDDLRFKMYETTPFTFTHFQLVVEKLNFDRGVVHSAMDRVVFLHIKGYLSETTKTEIESYCKAHDGLWDSLLETVGRVEGKINEVDEREAAREEARKRDAVNGKCKGRENGKGQKRKKKNGKNCGQQQDQQ